MLPQKPNFGPIADAFERVINVAAYRGKWITSQDYACIINYEHDPLSPATMVDADTLVSALSKDSRFKNADDTSGTSGVFRNSTVLAFCNPTEQKSRPRSSVTLLLLSRILSL